MNYSETIETKSLAEVAEIGIEAIQFRIRKRSLSMPVMRGERETFVAENGSERLYWRSDYGCWCGVPGGKFGTLMVRVKQQVAEVNRG